MNILQDGENILQYIGLDRAALKRYRATKTLCRKKVIVYYYLHQICGYRAEEVATYCYKCEATIRQSIKRYNNKLEEIKDELVELHDKTTTQTSITRFIMS